MIGNNCTVTVTSNRTDPFGLVTAVEYAAAAGLGSAVAGPAAAIVACLFNQIRDEVQIAAARQQGQDMGKTYPCFVRPMISQPGAGCEATDNSGSGNARGGVKGPGRSSFAGGTPVLTKEGLRAIETIQVGDLVGSWNPKTNQVEWQKVTARVARKATQALKITVKDGVGNTDTLIVTQEHPFLTPATAWHAIAGFKVGDKMLSVDRGLLTITAIDADTKSRQVYNLEVAENHSYAVGANGAWVHNLTMTVGGGFNVTGGIGGDFNGGLAYDFSPGNYNMGGFYSSGWSGGAAVGYDASIGFIGGNFCDLEGEFVGFGVNLGWFALTAFETASGKIGVTAGAGAGIGIFSFTSELKIFGNAQPFRCGCQ